MKCQKIVKNVPCMYLQELKITFSHFLLCSTNSPKPKDIQFTMIYGKEEHQLLIFEKLVPAKVCAFLLEK